MAAKAIARASNEDVEAILCTLDEKKQNHKAAKTGIQRLRNGRYDDALSAFAEQEQDELCHSLFLLTEKVKELSEYAIELSKGNLSVEFPDRHNYLAMSVKNLHSKLNHLVWQIGQVAHGDYSQTADYMGELSDGFNWMTAQLSMRQTMAERERVIDSATGLLNRDAFMRHVYEEINSATDKNGVLLCGGLDNIKYINETYGHENGDDYIAAAADMFRLFEADGAIVARISGDEFAVYFHGFDGLSEALDFTDNNLQSRLTKTTVILEDTVKIRASYGVAFYPQDAPTVDNLVKFASHTMFEVKKINRGTLLRFNADVYRTKVNMFDRQEKLNRLIDERLIRFAFQPIVRLADASLFGYEALMRPTSGDFTGPLDVLSLAEAQSKIYQLEALTYEMIFEWINDNAGWLDTRRIFFNSASTHYFNAEELRKLHPEYEKICQHIVFEVLESAAVGENFTYAIRNFRNELPALIAIDDYGCGYSNDLRLISLAPDIVKIDRFFIKGLDANPDKQQLLTKIIGYCRSKSIDTLAEGIETRGELETVVRLGFTYAQGFYLGMPEFEPMMLDADLQKDILGCRGSA